MHTSRVIPSYDLRSTKACDSENTIYLLVLRLVLKPPLEADYVPCKVYSVTTTLKKRRRCRLYALQSHYIDSSVFRNA